MDWMIYAGVFFGAFLAMEGVAWVVHRYVMHGFMWFWHKSHHEPHNDALEQNDWFAVLFSLPAIVGIYFGLRGYPVLLALGLGVTAYGFFYFLAHDVLVHRRVKILPVPKKGYLARLHEAHMLHHVVRSRDGAVSFGFLYAPKPSHLRALLDRKRQETAES